MRNSLYVSNKNGTLFPEPKQQYQHAPSLTERDSDRKSDTTIDNKEEAGAPSHTLQETEYKYNDKMDTQKSNKHSPPSCPKRDPDRKSDTKIGNKEEAGAPSHTLQETEYKNNDQMDTQIGIKHSPPSCPKDQTVPKADKNKGDQKVEETQINVYGQLIREAYIHRTKDTKEVTSRKSHNHRVHPIQHRKQ